LLSLDPLARDLVVDIINEAVKAAHNRDQELAFMIIQELAKAMGGK
jgi:hypothetical protein